MSLTLTIHPILKDIIPPLSAEEYSQLEANILANGCLSPIVTWFQYVLDGHNRYEICKKHGIDFETVRVSEDLPYVDDAILWVIKNQLGRRNLAPEQTAFLRGKQYEAEKAKPTEKKKKKKSTTDNPLSVLENSTDNRTANRLAKQYRVSPATIQSDAKFAKAVDALTDVVPDARQAILSRNTVLDKSDVIKLADIAQDKPSLIQEVFDGVRGTNAPRSDTKELVQVAEAIMKSEKLDEAALTTEPDALSQKIKECLGKLRQEKLHSKESKEFKKKLRNAMTTMQHITGSDFPLDLIVRIFEAYVLQGIKEPEKGRYSLELVYLGKAIGTYAILMEGSRTTDIYNLSNDAFKRIDEDEWKRVFDARIQASV